MDDPEAKEINKNKSLEVKYYDFEDQYSNRSSMSQKNEVKLKENINLAYSTSIDEINNNIHSFKTDLNKNFE